MKTLMIDVVNRCYKFLLELFLIGGGEDLIDMLEQHDLLARWYDLGANGSSTVGDG